MIDFISLQVIGLFRFSIHFDSVGRFYISSKYPFFPGCPICYCLIVHSSLLWSLLSLWCEFNSSSFISDFIHLCSFFLWNVCQFGYIFRESAFSYIELFCCLLSLCFFIFCSSLYFLHLLFYKSLKVFSFLSFLFLFAALIGWVSLPSLSWLILSSTSSNLLI